MGQKPRRLRGLRDAVVPLVVVAACAFITAAAHSYTRTGTAKPATPAPSVAPLAVDCEGEWLPWGPCTSTCGPFGRRRRVFAVRVKPERGGAECPHVQDGVDAAVCNTAVPCGSDGGDGAQERRRLASCPANDDSGDCAVVSGGSFNLAVGNGSVVSGGRGNNVTGRFGFIGGGESNTAAGTHGAIGGGEGNFAPGSHGVVGGGQSNSVTASHSVVSGGDRNSAVGDFGVIGGGARNVVATYGVVGGGLLNTVSSYGSVVGAGEGNVVTGINGVISGGYQNTVVGFGGVVAGGEANDIAGMYGAVGGGYDNAVDGYAGTIGGGDYNAASGDYGLVGGGTNNDASAPYATVSGGRSNAVTGFASVVDGGEYNTASGMYGAIAGGSRNTASSPHGAVGGGYDNAASGVAAVVGGGQFNMVTGFASVIGGGFYNSVSGYLSVVGGGWYNTVVGFGTVVDGGESNNASGVYGAVGGGNLNTVAGYAGVVSGGVSNAVPGNFSVVGGGLLNTATAAHVAIGGGARNVAQGSHDVVAGGESNNVSASHGVVSGGERNTVLGDYGVVGGGFDNRVPRQVSVVGGGEHNTASGSYCVVGGGSYNIATAYAGTISGGQSNTGSGTYGVVSGGSTNAVLSPFGVVGGGYGNTASMYMSVVGGGMWNTASLMGTVGGGGANFAGFGATVAGGGADFDAQNLALDGPGNRAEGVWSAIGGGRTNTATGDFSVISGGYSNRVVAYAGVVSGGLDNTAAEPYAVVSGGFTNNATAFAAVVSGGTSNSATRKWGVVGGGVLNAASGYCATVVGGKDNVAAGSYAIVGGRANTADAYGSIGGGWGNSAGRYATIAGGGGANHNYLLYGPHHATGTWSAIGGGFANTASGTYSAISGGNTNMALGYATTVAGGLECTAAQSYGVVSGGSYNSVIGAHGVISGGYSNTVAMFAGVVGGGYWNTASALGTVAGGAANFAGFGATVAGGAGDHAHGSWSAIGGGRANAAKANFSVVSGGNDNLALGYATVVAGGTLNNATQPYASVAGGFTNFAVGFGAAVSGGAENTALQGWSTVGGGRANIASSPMAVVAGGSFNAALGEASMILGGSFNSVDGSGSMGLGTRTSVTHSNAAVLGFHSTTDICSSMQNYSVSICAENGLFVNGQRLDNATAAHRVWLQMHDAHLEEHAAVLTTLLDNNTATWSALNTTSIRVDELASTLLGVNADIEWLGGSVNSINATTSAQQEVIASQQALIDEQRAEIDALHSTVKLMNSSLASLTLAVDRSAHSMNATISAQQDVIANQQALIDEQRADIDALHNTVKSMNDSLLHNTVESMNNSLASLTLAVEQMLAATAFAATTDAATLRVTDCVGDQQGPCSQSQNSTTASAASSSTTPQNPAPGRDCVGGAPCTTPENKAAAFAVALQACHQYPCEDSISMFAWDQTVHVAASVDVDESVGADERTYNFSLATGDDVVWTQTGSTNRFASFLPSDIAVDSLHEYELSVDVRLANGLTSATHVSGLQFAAPPLVHDATVEWVNGSAALNLFVATVDATDATDLTYQFWIVDNSSGWRFLAVEGGAASATMAVPTTRDYTLDVAVTNAHGSTAWCTACGELAAPSHNVSASAILAEMLDQVGSVGDGGDTAAMLLAAVDVVDSDDEFQQLLVAVNALLNVSSTPVSQGVVVLSEVINSMAETAIVADDIAGPLATIAQRASEFSDDTLELYIEAVDKYESLLAQDGSPSDTRDRTADLDETLAAVCVGVEAGDVPDGAVVTFEQSSFSLSCASTEETAVIDAGSAVLSTPADGITTVTMTAWNNISRSDGNGSRFLSNVHGVTVDYDGVQDEADAVSVDDSSSLTIAVDAVNVKAVRKALSCKYYDRLQSIWSGRGVVLRGLKFDIDLTVHAICATSHFTLFTVEDSSEAAKVVEAKIQLLSERVEGMNNVDLLADNADVNWLILGVCVGITVLFAGIIVAAKACGRSEAVQRGLMVFQKVGVLSKPTTMGSSEYEAVLRRWVSARDAMKLIVFEVLTSNAVFGFLFHWDHDAIVFGRADKAVTLLGAILMTFVASAFLFNPNESSSSDPLVIVWSALVSAALTNVLLLPVQHFLPYMVSNVNSVTTFSPMPMPLLTRELRRLSCWRSRRRRVTATAAELQLKAVGNWIDLTHGQRNIRGGAATTTQRIDEVSAASTKLRFFNCVVDLPSPLRAGVLTGCMDLHGTKSRVIAQVTSLQRRVRKHIRLKRDARRVEFEAWYTGMKTKRHLLGSLSTAALVILTAFTLMICVLLSVTFNADESVLWITDVSQSLLVQVFVTDPGVTLAVILLKLFVSWFLLKYAKSKVQRQLVGKMDVVSAQIARASANVHTLQARIAALQAVASGDSARLEAERFRCEAAKAKCAAGLRGVALAKSKLLQKLGAMRNARTPHAHRIRSEIAALDRQESTASRELAAAEAALQVLNGTQCDAQAELQQAEQALCTLKRRVTNLAQFQNLLDQKQQRLHDKPVRAVKRSAIAPVVPMLAREEPEAERTAMPAAQTASSGARVHATPLQPAVGGRRRRTSIPSAAAKRTPTSRQTKLSGPPRKRDTSPRQSGSRLGQHHHHEVAAPAGRNSSVVGGRAGSDNNKPIRDMSWKQLLATRQQMADKAARRARNLMRGRNKSFRTRSPKLIRAVLARRERAKRAAGLAGPHTVATDAAQFNL